MSRILPRYVDSRIDDERKLARILLEAVDETPTTVTHATLPGDSRRLRGIPVVARSVAGVSPGSDPVAELLRNDRIRC